MIAGMGKRFLLVAGIVVIGVVAATVWWMQGRTAVGEPPAPADLSIVDPAVARLIEQVLEEARQSPRDPVARAKLGMVYQANDLMDLAVASYEQVLAMDEDDATAWYLLARAQSRLGRPDLAVAAMDRSIELDPSYAPAFWNRGFWLIDLGRLDEAEASFTRALQARPDELAALVGMARVELQRRQFQDAATRLEGLLRSGSVPPETVPYLRHLLGTAYQRMNRPDLAAGHLAGATGQPPTWTDTRVAAVSDYRRGYKASIERAGALLAARRGPEAVRLLQDLRATHPADPTLLNTLATTLITMGRFQEATDVLADSLQFNPQHIPTHLNLSTAFERRNDLTKATWYAAKAVELNPSFAPARLQHGRLLTMAQRWQEAADALQAAVRYGVTDPDTVAMLGWVLIMLQRWDEAVETFQLALTGAPNLATAHAGLARALAETGDLEQASRHLRRARTLDPNTPNLESTAQRVRELQNTPRPPGPGTTQP